MRPGREGPASAHTRVLHGKESAACRHVGAHLNEKVQVCPYMYLSLLPKCPMISCVYAPLLCVALCVSLCACVYVCLPLLVSLCSPNPDGEGREMTWFYSSFPVRYSAVVDPVAKWTSIILLTSPLFNTPSFLQAWRTPHQHLYRS